MATKAGIEARRAAFRELSMLMVIWAGLSKVGGLNMVYCYCSGGGSWLQVDKQLANPYFGKKMLRCGKIISG